MLDKFSDEDKKKYRHLERLEARGKFDVSKLKENIINNYKEKWVQLLVAKLIKIDYKD